MSDDKITLSLDYEEARSLLEIVTTWADNFAVENCFPGLQDNPNYKLAMSVLWDLDYLGVSDE